MKQIPEIPISNQAKLKSSLDQVDFEDTSSDEENLYFNNNNSKSSIRAEDNTTTDQSKLQSTTEKFLSTTDELDGAFDKFQSTTDNLDCTLVSETTSSYVNTLTTLEEVVNKASSTFLQEISTYIDEGSRQSDPVNNKYIISIPKYYDLRDDYETDCLIRIPDLFKKNTMSRMYEVNGSMFTEGDRQESWHDDDAMSEYELYKVDKSLEGDDEDMSTSLEVQVQVVPQGVIINSNVFLWDAHWHTMALEDDQLFRCAVCQLYCDRSSCEDHIKTASHVRNLDSYRPLKRFDLSIVRRINLMLHCGVCNNIFNTKEFKVHENSKTHEENLLTAINKVSDLMYDSNIHRYDYGERRFHSSDLHADAYDRNMRNYNRNMSDNVRNMPQETYRNNGEYHFDANAINNTNINVYEEYSDNQEDEEENIEEEETIEEEDEIEEYVPPCEGISYASMASKPTMQIPKFLKIDLGNKEVRVKFESWHMITRMESNKYYCMVCNKKEHVRYKARHCAASEHRERLARCSLVRAFQDYLVRRVDDKLYHCGHCNNLQYQDQMEDHIESTHPKKNRNYVETTTVPALTTRKTKLTDKTNTKTVIEPKKTECDKSVVVKKELQYLESKSDQAFLDPNINPDFDIFGDIPLTPFGFMMRIPALNFNLILRRDGGYYCAICDKVCVDVKVHVEEMEHVELMTMTPFIKPFQNNLTRAVRGMLHCSLCNELFPVTEVRNHNIDQPHTNALAAALGMKKAHKPTNTTRQYTKTTRSVATNEQITTPNQAMFGAAANNVQPLNLAVNTNLHQMPNNTGNVLKPASSSQINSQQLKETKADIPQPKPAQNGGTQSLLGPLPNFFQGIPLQNLENYQKNKQEFHSLLRSVQRVPNAGPCLPYNEPNLANTGPNLAATGRNQSNPGQEVPTSGQSFPIPAPKVSTQAIKSIPPMFNSIFPSLPPVNAQALNQQFMAPPVNFRPSLPPFPHLSPNNTPNLLSPNIPTDQTNLAQSQNIKNNTYNPNQEMERKTLIITNTKDSQNGMVKSGNDNSKTGIDNSKLCTDQSRPGANKFRHNSVNSKSGSDNSRRSSTCKSDHVDIDSRSEDEENKMFDEEEMVFVKLKTTHLKIPNLAYHTLIFVDNGIRYCFVCSTTVRSSQVQRHVDSRRHVDFIAENKFIDKYGVQLIRQMYLMYHCALCNVIMTRKEVKMHLEWRLHLEAYDAAHLPNNKKNRKKLKSGVKEHAVETQKEAIYHNVNEPQYVVLAAYRILASLDDNRDSAETKPAKESTRRLTAVKRNKMVILNNVVMKISFEHWHGITTNKHHTKCIVCQLELAAGEVLDHVETEYHAVGLGKTFEKSYYPALVRKISESSVNCMTCNLELPNSEHMILEHAHGRKHARSHEEILEHSARSDSYADCYEDYLTL